VDSADWARCLQGRWHFLERDVSLKKACIDSRILEPGDVFFALKTNRADGHDYVSDAVARGASAVVVSRLQEKIPSLLVSDPRRALWDWAQEKRRRFQGRVIALVGSLGKTSAKELLKYVLEGNYSVFASPGSYNNDLGLPLTLIACPEKSSFLLLELGANAPGEIGRLADLARPDHLFVLPLAEVHLEKFKDMEGVKKAKAEVLAHLSKKALVMLPRDLAGNQYWHWPEKVLTWGTLDSTCPPCAFQRDFPGMRLKTPEGMLKVDVMASWFPALVSAVAGFLKALNCSLDWKKLEKFSLPPGRLEIKKWRGIWIINDAFSANPRSVEEALGVLAAISGRRVFVFGDMLELGNEAGVFHRKVGEFCNSRVDLLLTWGPLAALARESYTGKSYSFSDQDNLEKTLRSTLESGDGVLFKASNKLHLQALAEKLFFRRQSA
jgi:UDP-N-acetylmuramoyl-tripeptide--D-alanyl-D-alanine ligase